MSKFNGYGGGFPGMGGNMSQLLKQAKQMQNVFTLKNIILT